MVTTQPVPAIQLQKVYVKEQVEMTIKLNFTSPTQDLVKTQDRNLGLNLSGSNANQSAKGYIQTKDLLTLTHTASNLNKLVEPSANSPFVDVTRVSEIKRTIEGGNINFNSTRVAQKLIQFENAFS